MIKLKRVKNLLRKNKMSDIKEKKSSVYTEYFKIGFRKSIEYKSYIIL